MHKISGYTYNQYHRSSKKRGAPRTFVKIDKRLTDLHGVKRIRNVYVLHPAPQNNVCEYVRSGAYFYTI